MNAPRIMRLAQPLGLVALYVALAFIATTFLNVGHRAIVLWLACAAVLPLLQHTNKAHLVPAIILGAWLAGLIAGWSVSTAAIIALRHTLLVLCGLWILRRKNSTDAGIRTTAAYLQITLLACVVGLLSALLNAGLAILAPTLLHLPSAIPDFYQQWAGQMLAIIIILPIMLEWRQLPRDWASSPRRALEVSLILTAAFLVGQVVFFEWIHTSLRLVARGYWMFLFITWAAVRLGPHGTVLMLGMVALQALLGAEQGLGFFSNDLENTHLANYFFYMLCLSTVGMALATYVAEQRQREQSIRQWANAFEHSPHGMIIATHPDLSLIACNPALCMMTGHHGESLLGTRFDEQVAMADRHQFADKISDTQQSGKASFEIGLSRTDGPPVPTQVDIVAIHNKEGPPIYYIATLQDISERKLTEESLRKLSLAVEQSSAGIIISNTSNRIEYVNETLLITSGYTREELIGNNPSILSSGDSAHETFASMWEALTQGHTWSGEFRNRRKDGSTYLCAATITPLRQPDGQITHYVASEKDVTEERHLSAELAHYQHHLEQLVEERTAELKASTATVIEMQFAIDHAGVGIHWLDASTGHFIYVNRIAAEMLGYAPEEMQFLYAQEIYSEFFEADFSQISRQLRREGSIQFETTLLRKDGQSIPIEVSAYFQPGKDGSSAKVIAFVVDIWLRKAADAALIHAKEAAESASAAKTAFLANMSHEIRTPLNAITGLAHLIRRDGLTPRQAERLDKLDAAGQHLLGTINAILDLSKIEAGEFALDALPIRVDSLPNNVVSMLQERARDKHLELIVNTPHLPYCLLGDPIRLQQALLNYVTNAITFTEQGHVTIRIQLQEETPEDTLILFEVEDTGIGIDAPTLTRLFTSFSQADNSTTRKYGGTGLGLSITRRFAELMGGKAGACSTPGLGSTFWFTARLKKCTNITPTHEAGQRIDAEAAIKTNFPGRRILLAEDEPINREIAQMLLTDVGQIVDTAEDGAQALELAHHSIYDIILMDMQMPNVNGLDATRQIRKLTDNTDTPILAMTANAFVEDKNRCLEAGMDDFITKPINVEDLYRTLLTWLSSPR
jgi:two-component system, sensor histidine kinase and response regulator